VIRAGSRALARAAALVAVLGALGPAHARANELVTITIPDQQGEIPSKWLTYDGPPRAGVILPDNYDPQKRYPLVVYLGGLGGNYERASAGMTAFHVPAIMVIPEPGNGWYADWWNGGERGDPAWESYDLNEVLPAVLSRYRIRPERRYHAIIGISMGGLGATYLGGRLPGFFGSVATLSGFVDTQYYAPITAAGMGLVSGAPQHGDYEVDPVYGPPYGFYSDGHNPTQLAMNLQHTRVFQSTGNGVPSNDGMTDPTGVPAGSALEGPIIYPMNQRYHHALADAGVDVTYQAHTGGHDAPDGTAEFRAMLQWGLFQPVVTRPNTWVNETVATSGQLWDIGYRFAEPPNQVVRFRRSGNSLSVSAAGSDVTLTTAQGCVIETATPATVRVKKCR
jgi:S-formylglutathione hydrolase FrmB